MAMEVPGVRSSRTAKKLGDETVEAGWDGITGTDLPQGADGFYLTPQECADYGMTENEAYTWVLDPASQLSKGAGIHRVKDQKRLGGRTVADPDSPGELVSNRDLLLCFYPRSIKEKKEQQEALEHQAYEKRKSEGYPGQFDMADKEAIRASVRAQRAANTSTGLIGETKGDPRIWYNQISAAERKADAERFRRGTRHINRNEAAAAMIDAQNMGRKGQRSFQAPDMPRDANGRLLRAK